MIRLGLRLTLNGGREAAVRLVLTAAAVALGASLLLITLAGINAVNSQNARYAWLATFAASAPPGPGSRPVGGQPTGRDPLWWQLRADHYGGQLIGRVDVAATGPDSPVPPGLSRLPGPGPSASAQVSMRRVEIPAFRHVSRGTSRHSPPGKWDREGGRYTETVRRKAARTPATGASRNAPDSWVNTGRRHVGVVSSSPSWWATTRGPGSPRFRQ